MAEDPLDMVLRLVAEGRLTAEEAGPILAALDARPDAKTPPPHGPAAGSARGFEGDRPAEGAGSAGRSLRVVVTDRDRTVVNLRLPLALGRYAVDRVPGLSSDQVARVQEALTSGLTGPVLVVDDEHGGVRIEID